MVLCVHEREREQYSVLVIFKGSLSNFDNTTCEYLGIIIIAELESLVMCLFCNFSKNSYNVCIKIFHTFANRTFEITMNLNSNPALGFTY